MEKGRRVSFNVDSNLIQERGNYCQFVRAERFKCGRRCRCGGILSLDACCKSRCKADENCMGKTVPHIFIRWTGLHEHVAGECWLFPAFDACCQSLGPAPKEITQCIVTRLKHWQRHEVGLTRT